LAEVANSCLLNTNQQAKKAGFYYTTLSTSLSFSKANITDPFSRRLP